ncbi:MAG: methyltransferase [Bacteroidota bacterium]|jgi:protein-S-isoprenylcysteine O-methyltransferase Ste14
MKLIAKFALPILIVAILYLLISGKLFSPSPFVIAAQVLAVALSIWARQSFQAGQFSADAEPKEGPLLSTGPYAFIRHPMYTAALLLLWSSIFGHLSITTVIIGLIVTSVVSIRVVSEEQVLRVHFPDYAEYSRKTKRIIPFII